jgi:hypothetical protein
MDLDYTRALYPPGGEHLGKELTEAMETAGVTKCSEYLALG